MRYLRNPVVWGVTIFVPAYFVRIFLIEPWIERLEQRRIKVSMARYETWQKNQRTYR
jgi:hypothetical protein